MADGANVEPQLCSEQFGSGAARGCLVAADGSLQWESWGWRWWGFPGPFTVKPQGRDGGGVGTPRTASPPLSGLMAVFLPQGFPDSVSPDYLPYQLWDSVQIQLACWAASSLPGGKGEFVVLVWPLSPDGVTSGSSLAVFSAPPLSSSLLGRGDLAVMSATLRSL
uniref:RUS family member 1 n=1 Tax=Ailuropoda melanoleuca TaxID=9646 RepID=A0A7N5K3F5_AILME